MNLLMLLCLSVSSTPSSAAQEADPAVLDRHSRQGEQALAQGRYEDAARAYEKLELSPATAEVHAKLERYGGGLIKLAFDILAHRQTPPALFIHHHLITSENVDHFYPNDALLGQLAPADGA